MRRNRLDIRYAWIEASIRYAGRFDKISYGDYFDLTPSQISSDQVTFMRAFNHEARHRLGNGKDVLEIDRGKLSIIGALPKEAVFDIPDIREWLRTVSTVPFFEVEKYAAADPDMVAFQNILSAIASKRPVQISLFCRRGEEDVRDVSPHALFDVSGRIHTRLWDHVKKSFYDLPLDRISTVHQASLPYRYKEGSKDTDWVSRRSVDFMKNSFKSSQSTLKGKNAALQEAVFPAALSDYVTKQVLENFGPDITVTLSDIEDGRVVFKIIDEPRSENGDDFTP